jgi:hypothetical protein
MKRLVHWLCYRKHFLTGVEVDDGGAIFLPVEVPDTHITVTYTANVDLVTEASAFVYEPRGWFRWFKKRFA